MEILRFFSYKINQTIKQYDKGMKEQGFSLSLILKTEITSKSTDSTFVY